MRKRDREEIFTDKYEDGYKGFNINMQCCKSKKYKVKEIFKEIKASICRYGIHYCKKIGNVFSYYSPGGPNRYAKIRARILTRKDMNSISYDNKKVTTSLYVEKELSMYEIIYKRFFEELNNIEEIKSSKQISDIHEKYSGIVIGNSGVAKNYRTIVAHNECSGTYINMGRNNIGICNFFNSISALDGTQSSIAITNGSSSISSAANNGHHNVAICNGDNSRAYIGAYEQNSVAITTGYGSCVDNTSTDRDIILCGLGTSNIAKGKIGTWIILAERSLDDYRIINIRSERIDGKKLKADTYYKLKNNEFIEVSE